MNLGATLYVKDSNGAVELYKKAFGLTLGYNLSYEDTEGMKAYGLDVADDYVPYKGYFHADMVKNDKVVFSISGEMDANVDGSALGFYQKEIQLSIGLDSMEAVQHAFDVLSEEGRVECEPAPAADIHYGSVIDKYNIWWYLDIG